MPQPDSTSQAESPRESDLLEPLAPNIPIVDEKTRARESDPPQRVWRIVSKAKIPAMFKKKVDKTQELISMMQAYLPSAVRVAPKWLPSFRNQGMPISAKQSIYIHSVFDGGDEMGIACDVTPFSNKKKALVISLTFLE